MAAGNLMDIQKMHPALRSRIRGYGYEVYMESTMRDNEQNRDKLIKFIAQEVKKDGRIPPFDYDACMEIIDEARRRSGKKNSLSLILRDLGGVIRAAGDIAVEKGGKVVTRKDVIDSLSLAKPIEAQYAEQMLDYTKDYQVFSNRGLAIGKVNGLAVLGEATTATGIVTPIAAEVTPASSRSEGKLIATGKLGKIAQEAVKNISAVIKRHMNRDIASYDIHVQFIQTYSGVEGDSASVSVAVSVISAMEGIPIRQDTAMTGSLSVRGAVLPVGGVTAKVRAAIDARPLSLSAQHRGAHQVRQVPGHGGGRALRSGDTREPRSPLSGARLLRRGDGHTARGRGDLWLVDPIDGTKAFVREYPMFSTQIALMRRGQNHPRRVERAGYGETLLCRARPRSLS